MTIRYWSGVHAFGRTLFEIGGTGSPDLLNGGAISTGGLILNPGSHPSGAALGAGTSVSIGPAAVSLQAAALAPALPASVSADTLIASAVPQTTSLVPNAPGPGFTVEIGTPALTLAGTSAAAAGLNVADAALDKLQNGLAEIFSESQFQVASLVGAARTAVLDAFHSINGAVHISGGMIAIDAVAANGDGAALLAQLEALGLQSGASFGAIAGGLIPLDALGSVAHAGLLAFARPAYSMTESAGAGSVVSQDVQAMHADILQTTNGLTGAGITIGLLSDSFNTSTSTDKYANDVASGDLPAGINIIKDFAGGTDEGRAMAQMAYDIAPGASFEFYTADVSQADFANGIVTMAQHGDKIIVDDVRYFDEPMFQDGIIAQAEDIAYANGAMVFSSAGNYADRAYDSTFRDSGQTFTDPTDGITYELHDFDPGPGVSTGQSVTQSGSVSYILQWDQPFFSLGGAGATSDLALLLFSGSIYLGKADSTHPGGDPIEIAGLNGSGTVTVKIGVRQGTPLPNEIKYAMIGGSSQVNTFATSSATLYGHANSEHTIAVGAADWYNTPAFGQTPPLGEYFTSKGGQQILFDNAGNRLATPEVRPGVAFTAADGGNTTFFSSDVAGDADTLPNFYGTSAAAPNAAAIAALLMQADPHATRDQILAAMKGSAIDIGNLANNINSHTLGVTTGAGADAWTGTGLIQADQALTNLQTATAPVPNIPALTGLTGTSTHAAEQGSAVTLLAGAPTITDADGDHLTSAIVQITGGTFSANESSAADDALSVAAGALAGTNITASYDAASETLTLSGSDTLANYAAVLAAVQYTSSGDNPTDYGNITGRTITWTVSDGTAGVPDGQQNSGTTTIAIDAMNDAPVNNVGGTLAATEDTAAIVTGISIDDPDSGLTTAQFTTTLSVAHGTLLVAAGFQPTIAAMTISGTGTATLQLQGTQSDINSLFATGALSYQPAANYNGSDTLHIVTSDGGGTGSGGALSDTDDKAISIAAVNDVPVISAPTDAAVTFTELGSAVPLMQGVTITDPDAPANFAGGSLTLGMSGSDGEITLIPNNGFAVVGTTLDYNGDPIGTIFGLGTFNLTVSGLTANVTPAVASALAAAFQYDIPGHSPSAADHVALLSFHDGGNTGSGGDRVNFMTQTVHIAAINEAPTVSAPGGQSGTEDTNLVFGSASGNAITLADDGEVGSQETVTLTVAHGTLKLPFPYNQTDTGDGTSTLQVTGSIGALNLYLNGLTYRGDLNYHGSDTLTVTINDNGNTGSGGALSAQQTIGITLAPDGIIDADATHNNPAATSGNDFFRFAPGGTYTVDGLGGNDVFLFVGDGNFTNADQIDGGVGTDQIALQGDYWTTPLTLGAGVVNVESLVLLSFSDRRFSGPLVSPHSYNITTVDQNVAAGQQLTIDANRLGPDEDFTFNGSAEKDGSFFIYGGMGTDHLTGGAKNDVFLFGNDASSGGLLWGSLDFVDGGGGINQLALRGDYSGIYAVHFGANQIHNIQSLALMSAFDTRFGALGSHYHYDITMDDGNLAAGQQMTVDAGNLRNGETVTFNGSAEADGSFRVFGGAGDDDITGSQNNDILVGGLGADRLTGGGGDDTFLYHSVAESTPASHDLLINFTLGDIIDLSAIDGDTTTAGQQHFHFVDGGVFTNHAGELVAADTGGGVWSVSGDINGDGVADFQLTVIAPGGHQINANDFHL
ncbi:MAG TPA: S8 family serine peptidase [Allosphingosinicella sp.]|jgi:hypothetical protein|nr:S8 family serine peptidase [Allosphingosinicella sp.]